MVSRISVNYIMFNFLVPGYSLLYVAIFLTLKQVAGYAAGGGHVLHMVCDLTIAADNAIFGQTGPKVLESLPFCLFMLRKTKQTCQ